MTIIPLGLFLLGVIFLLIGWRWQSPRGEENALALKGLAYLKNEIGRVQDQVYGLENELHKTKQLYDQKENSAAVDQKDTHFAQPDLQELKHEIVKELKHQISETKAIEQPRSELDEVSLIKDYSSSSLFAVNPEERLQEEDSSLQGERHISEKFREVVELAALGQRIPEIAQCLFMSQDAVRMVLSMQSKGGTR